MKILLVEDEPGIQAVVQKYMESKNAEVDVADTGEDAFCMATKNHYDIILLDFHLPGWDGVEAVKALDMVDKPPNILVNTAYDIHKLKEDLKGHANVKAFIPKPFKLDELWQTMQDTIASTD